MSERCLGVTLQMAGAGVPASALPGHIMLYQNSAEVEGILHYRGILKADFSLSNGFRVPAENSVD